MPHSPDSGGPPGPLPYWYQGETPVAIKALLNGRLNRLHLHLLDVNDVKDLLELRSLRFTERLFGLIDVHCTGYITVDQLVDFVYAFENHHLQFRLYMIFHCYDPISRGALTVPDIKTMFMENLVEGGCRPNHRMVECLTEAVLRQINAEGPLINYHQLMEVIMYHPHVLCHLVKSKLPPEREDDRRNDPWLKLKDQSGRWLSMTLFLLISTVAFSVSLSRYGSDTLGPSHAVARSASDLLKIFFAFFWLTLFDAVPFIYRKLSGALHVRFVDVRTFRKLMATATASMAFLHGLCHIITVWQLTRTDDPDAWSTVSVRSTRPSFASLLTADVMITGVVLFIFVTACILLISTEDVEWPWHAPFITRMRAWYGNGGVRFGTGVILVVLLALHVSTTLVRRSFKLPCLIWIWLGFPVLALILDNVIFRLLDPPSLVEIVDYRILPKNGVLLTLTKPVDCRLGALSFVFIKFPSSPMSEFRAVPVLSHPSEDHLSLLVQAKDAWSRQLIRHFEKLEANSKNDADIDETIPVDVEAPREEAARDPISLNRQQHHPDRLTRLNTRVVYLTRTQRLNVIGDDPQVSTERRHIELSPNPRRNSNFNVIFEITPASLSTEDSIRREEQRINSRQVTDAALMNASPLLESSSIASVHVGLRPIIRGPYKLDNTFQEEKMLTALSYDALLLVGQNFSSLSLVPLCSYILRRKTMAYRERYQSVTVRKLIINWQLDRYEDVVWLMELLEPMHDLPSLIRLEVHIYVQSVPKMISNSKVLLASMEHIVEGGQRQKIPLDSRMVLYFGRRDCVYQLALLRDEIGDGRVGIMMDAPGIDRRCMDTWIHQNAEDRFHFLSLGIVAI